MLWWEQILLIVVEQIGAPLIMQWLVRKGHIDPVNAQDILDSELAAVKSAADIEAKKILGD